MMAIFTLNKLKDGGMAEYRQEGSTATWRTGPKMWNGGKAPKTIEVRAEGLHTPKAKAPESAKPKAKASSAKKVTRG